MSEHTLKADFLKRVDAWPTKDVEVRGTMVTIQALNRDQAMTVSEFGTPGEREAYMISKAVIGPFDLTIDEAQQLREVSEPLELEEFTAEIVRLSGMDKKAKEAQNDAFKSVRDESGA
jgi:hypothetical protein